MKPEVGRYDALYGLVLLGNGKDDFVALSSKQSGLKIEGEVRLIKLLKGRDGQKLVFVRNNDSMVFYKMAK